MRRARAFTFIICIAASACAASTPHVSAPTGSIKPDGQAKIGDRTRCIVTGDEMVVTASTPHADYKGKTYYFCCADCPGEFLKEPEKYIRKATARLDS
jgi:YHS domain-containing protein